MGSFVSINPLAQQGGEYHLWGRKTQTLQVGLRMSRTDWQSGCHRPSRSPLRQAPLIAAIVTIGPLDNCRITCATIAANGAASSGCAEGLDLAQVGSRAEDIRDRRSYHQRLHLCFTDDIPGPPIVPPSRSVAMRCAWLIDKIRGARPFLNATTSLRFRPYIPRCRQVVTLCLPNQERRPRTTITLPGTAMRQPVRAVRQFSVRTHPGL
jgi:hypothetical protein